MGSDRSKGKCGISENSYLSWVKGVFKLRAETLVLVY